MDFLGLLAQDGAVLDWVQFRAHILVERMGEFRVAVQEAGGRDKVFGSDVFPASTGLLGGHWYGKWEEATDFLTGGSSHGGVVGWATGVTNLAREWTAALCRHAQGLDESEVLALVWRMFGVEDLDLPETVAGVAEETFAHRRPVRAGSGPLKKRRLVGRCRCIRPFQRGRLPN